jgi:hypothetical protein
VFQTASADPYAFSRRFGLSMYTLDAQAREYSSHNEEVLQNMLNVPPKERKKSQQ